MKLKRILDEIEARIRKFANSTISLVYHYDVDGVASAALVARILLKMNVNFKPIAVERGKAEEIAVERIKEYGLPVLFLDYVPSEKAATELKGMDVTIIDHHIHERYLDRFDYFTSADIEPGYALSYLIYKVAQRYKVASEYIALAGCFWDKGLEKSEFEYSYEELFERLLPYNLLVSFKQVRGAEILFHIFLECKEEKEAMERIRKLRLYNEALRTFQRELKRMKPEKRDGVWVLFIKTKFKHIRIYVDYFTFKYKGTFIFAIKEDHRYKLSFRTNEEINLHKIVKKLVEEFDEFTGGGHKYACGGLLRSKEIEPLITRFVELLNLGKNAKK